jgi:hypothetical protein
MKKDGPISLGPRERCSLGYGNWIIRFALFFLEVITNNKVVRVGPKPARNEV